MSARPVLRGGSLRLALVALGAMVLGGQAEAAALSGRAVADVLRDAESAGIRIIFTDQSVPRSLRVSSEPLSPDPVEQLREVLRAHALVLDEVSPGVYAVTREREPEITVPAVRSPYVTAPLDEVEVVASRYTIEKFSARDSLQMGHVDMERQPALFNDAARSIRRFPGTAGHDLSSRTFVRGGTPDDNVVMLDGIALYDPFHLPGLPVNFSVIDPAVVGRVDFYSGVLPVETGDRMGAQVDMHLREPSETLGGRVALGVLDASALASGPLSNDSGDWLLFARRGLAGRTNQMTDPEIEHPELLDALGRARYRLDDDSVLTVGALGARDHARVFDSGSMYLYIFGGPTTVFSDEASDRAYAWTVFERAGDAVASRTALSFTSIGTRRNGYWSDSVGSLGSLDDWRQFRSAQLAQGWRRQIDSGSSMRWGAALREDRATFNFHRLLSFQGEVAEFFERDRLSESTLMTKASLHEQSAYWGINHTLLPRLTFDGGLRWSHASYSTHEGGSALDPRLSLRFDASANTRLRYSFGRMTQTWAAAELPVEQGRLDFDERSANTLHVLALERDFGSWLLVRAEYYKKRVSHPRPRRENLFFPVAFLPEVRPDEAVIQPDSSRMKGLDFYATARLSRHFSGWLSYSHSDAMDRLAGQDIRRAWDQPHSLGMGLTMERSTWFVSAEAFLHTNWPLTPLATDIQTDASGALHFLRQVGERNSEQRGRFITLNLKTERRVRFESGSLHLALEVANATNRTNVCCDEVTFLSSGTAVEEAQYRRHWLPMFPYATVSWEF